MPEPLTPDARALAATLRAALDSQSDEALDQFLGAYAMSRVAEHLILLMNREVRIAFFVQLRKHYPENFPEEIWGPMKNEPPSSVQ